MSSLLERYLTDQRVWDQCADTYEKHIVGGHPDILAYENFEEDLLDRILMSLARDGERPVRLMDIGCGSGRLHLRYAAKTIELCESEREMALAALKMNEPLLSYNPFIAGSLEEVWGIDFSARMLELGEEKLVEAGLSPHPRIKLTFEQGSAFDLEPSGGGVLPVAICLVNSIGVMQGPDGAEKLFESMRRAVEPAGGIAIISNFRRKFIKSHAFGQYGSTLDVSGQPVWLKPDTYASSEYQQVAHEYKLAYSKDPSITVEVYDSRGKLVRKEHALTLDEEKAARAEKTGEIRTYSDYESHWYSFDQIGEWVDKHWSRADGTAYHFPTSGLDMLRAGHGQMSLLDAGNNIKELMDRFELS
jgi:SAM-dependent methyltransferase